MKILVIASLTKSLLNFRRTLLEDFVTVSGGNVIACAPECDDAYLSELKKMGVDFRQLPMERTSTNPIADVRTFLSITSLIRKEKPDIILAYTQKPIIYGGLAARLFSPGRFYALQSGLGFVYSPENKNQTLRRFVSFLYRQALEKASVVFVFNSDDRAHMLEHGMIAPSQEVIQVAGSGVDPVYFPPAPLPEGPPVFLLIARLMKDKGLFEFVEAARRVRAVDPNVKFQILGPFDDNPAGISRQDVDSWVAEGAVEYLGETRDVRPYLARSTVFVLPSFHREGLPRAILEAMSTGRAIITCDSTGCRDTVLEGENGFLTPPQDAAALADAMLRFVREPSLAQRFGERSRNLVHEKFDVRLVNDMLLEAMGLTGNAPEAPHTDRPSILQRITDIVIGGGGLIVASPIIAIVAIGVYFSMGQPVLFRQKRAGRFGRPFELIKFRSMTDERDENGELLPDEKRTTPFGKLIRRLRLDELPELWNILRGQMAVVGPRPLFLESQPNLGQPGKERLSIRPGLTGWAQVNGNALLDDDHKLQLDLWYVKNRSLKLDFQIVFLTIWVMLAGEKVNRSNIEAAHESNSRRSG